MPTDDTDLDLLVLGAGMAGTNAALKSARAGWRTAIVDPLPYGGTCALRGCDPKKILRRGAEIIAAAEMMHGKGIDPGTLAIDWVALMRHKEGFTDPVPGKLERELKRNGVETLHGVARFSGPRTVDVGGRMVTARRILIATGARPRKLSFPGSETVIDSTAFLQLERLPPRILFIGGGLVSFEFAHIAARANSQTIIIEHGPRPLKRFDPDLVDILLKAGSPVGIDVRTSTDVLSLEPHKNGIRAVIESAGVAESVEVDLVVHGAGREADLEQLDLTAAGIASSPRGVTVHAHLQSTTNLDVFAAGDAADTAGMPLTPVAVAEGKVAVSNMLKSATISPDYVGIPAAVFTIPELVRVGMQEDEARQRGVDLDIRYTDTSGWYSNYRIGATHGAAKVLVDRATDQIVGAHLLGHGYAELINTFGIAIKLKLPARQLRSTIAAYPTVGSDLGSLL